MRLKGGDSPTEPWNVLNVISNNFVPHVKSTVFLTETKLLMLFSEIIIVHCEKLTKHINAFIL